MTAVGSSSGQKLVAKVAARVWLPRAMLTASRAWRSSESLEQVRWSAGKIGGWSEQLGNGGDGGACGVDGDVAREALGLVSGQKGKARGGENGLSGAWSGWQTACRARTAPSSPSAMPTRRAHWNEVGCSAGVFD